MALGKQSKILSKAQTDAVTSYLGTRRHGLRDQTIFLLSVKAGLRAKEIAHLKWSMVLGSDGTVGDAIHLTDVASKGKGGRIIPLNKHLRSSLIQLFEQERTRFGFSCETSFVITTERSASAGSSLNYPESCPRVWHSSQKRLTRIRNRAISPPVAGQECPVGSRVCHVYRCQEITTKVPMRSLLRTPHLPKYTKAFWVSYFFCIFWGIAVAIAFYHLAPEQEIFQNVTTVEAALSLKLSLRRIIAVVVGGVVISFLLFTNSKYLEKALILIAAWMWAAYIDDYLVMHQYVFVPDAFIAQFLIKLRPVAVVLVSWMAMECHLRRQAA